MFVKTETPPISDARTRFENELKNSGFDLPERPDSTLTGPRRWLIRGESSNGKLNQPNTAQFQPQSGEWGRYGVFMGDCLSPVMFPESGVLYVFDRDKLPAAQWISTTSSEYDQLIDRVALEYGLDLRKISDGTKAEKIIAENFYLYDPKTGIATAPENIPLTTVEHIFLTANYANQFRGEGLPTWLRGKVTILHQ